MMRAIPRESANMFSSDLPGRSSGHLPEDCYPTIFDFHHRKALLSLESISKQPLDQTMSLDGILNPTTPRRLRSSPGSGQLLSPASGITPYGAPAAAIPFRSCNDSPESETINFPPFEDLDPHSEKLALQFNVRPLGRIQQTPRSIPYNSDKRPLKGLAGLTKLNVYEYKFTVPGENKEWKVHWDYKEGWVQIAPFFKSLKYAKTAPGKMRDLNCGLRDVCHSVTGGAIDFQGYWMKYNSAREMATRFCHKIAPALIPIFGPSFPSDCVKPNAPGYGDMKVSPTTIQADVRAAEAAHRRLMAQNGVVITTTPSQPYVDEDLKLPALWSSVCVQSPRGKTPLPESRSSYMATPRETPTWAPQSDSESHGYRQSRAEALLSAEHTSSRQTRSTRWWDTDPNAIACQLDRQGVRRPSGPILFERSRVEINYGICRYPTSSTAANRGDSDDDDDDDDDDDGDVEMTVEEDENNMVKAAFTLMKERQEAHTLEEYHVAHTLATMRYSVA